MTHVCGCSGHCDAKSQEDGSDPTKRTQDVSDPLYKKTVSRTGRSEALLFKRTRAGPLKARKAVLVVGVGDDCKCGNQANS
jgi:hypothetical protein